MDGYAPRQYALDALITYLENLRALYSILSPLYTRSSITQSRATLRSRLKQSAAGDLYDCAATTGTITAGIVVATLPLYRGLGVDGLDSLSVL